MLKTDVIAVLKNSAKIAELNVESLEEIIRYAPYFIPAQLWLTKLKHEHQTIDYEVQLTKTAAVTPDREFLYNLIYKNPLRQKIEAATELTQAEDLIEETPSKVLPKAEVIKNEAKAEPEQAQFDEALPLTQVGKPKINAKELDLLELEILKHAAAASANRENQEIIEKNNSIEKSIEPIEKPVHPPQSDESEKKKFSAWLERINAKNLGENKPTGVHQNSLIDKFIKEQPQISKVEKTEFFKPSKMAKLSLVEHEEFVTETLAKIYKEQGNKQKAIKIYAKLSLKYPEKKNYFAAQISELQSTKKD